MSGRGADDDGTYDDDSDDVVCDDKPLRIALSVRLPCGMGGCRRPAREALAEPDPGCPGAWVLLPICPTCGASVQANARCIALSR